MVGRRGGFGSRACAEPKDVTAGEVKEKHTQKVGNKKKRKQRIKRLYVAAVTPKSAKLFAALVDHTTPSTPRKKRKGRRSGGEGGVAHGTF